MADSRKHLFKNNAVGRLAVGILVDDENIQLQPGQGALFPTVAFDDDMIFKITVENLLTGEREIMHVTDNTDDFFDVERAQEGTEALEFPAGPNVIVSHRVTAETLDYLRDNGGGGGLTLVPRSESYEFVLEDANTGIVNPAFNGANAYYIPAQADVAFKIGTFLVVKNGDPFKTVTVSIAEDFFDDPATGATVTTMTLNPLGIATFLKYASGVWTILGSGYVA